MKNIKLLLSLALLVSFFNAQAAAPTPYHILAFQHEGEVLAYRIDLGDQSEHAHIVKQNSKGKMIQGNPRAMYPVLERAVLNLINEFGATVNNVPTARYGDKEGVALTETQCADLMKKAATVKGLCRKINNISKEPAYAVLQPLNDVFVMAILNLPHMAKQIFLEKYELRRMAN